MHIVRRTLNVARTIGTQLAGAALTRVTATLDNLLADLFRAIDAGRAVRFEYVKESGEQGVRTVFPAKVWPSGEGNILVKGYDPECGADRDFRTDRFQSYALI